MMLRVIFHTRRAADKTSSLGTKTYFRHYRAGPPYLRLPYYFFFFFFTAKKRRVTKERQETTPARAWERKWVEKRASSALNGTLGRRRNSDLRERERKREGETGSVSGKRRTAVTRTHRSQGNKFEPELDWSVAKGYFPYFTVTFASRSQRDARNLFFLRKYDSQYPLTIVQSVQLHLID